MAKNKEKKQPMSEEEKKAKFGDKYDPNYQSAKQKPQPSDKAKRWDYAKRTNDWSWYALSEQIAKDFGSLPYNTLGGSAYTVTNNTRRNDAKINVYPQQIMLLLTQQSLNSSEVLSDTGSASTTDAGLRTAANQLYQYLRHVNSGARNYEPADVFMTILAIRDIYSQYCEIKRAIGLMQYYTMQNLKIPELLVRSLGFDYSDLIENYANYRGQLNVLAKRINAFAMPAYFKAFYRLDYIYSNVFMDSDSQRGQYYVFRRSGFYTFSGRTSEQGSELVWRGSYTSDGRIMSNTLYDLRNMIRAIETDTDALTMAGDVLAAFKDAQLLQMAQIPEDYVVAPMFDENILNQIENSVALSAYVSTPTALVSGDAYQSQWNMTQSNGQLNNIKLSWPSTAGNPLLKEISPVDYIFNSHKDKPDFKDNLDWSRLVAVCTALTPLNTGDNQQLFIHSTGLEMIVAYYMYTSKPDNDGIMNDRSTVDQTITCGTQVPKATVLGALKMANYDWHPFIYVYEVTGTAGTLTATAFVPYGDTKKMTIIDQRVATNLNNVATLAAFWADGLFDHTK